VTSGSADGDGPSTVGPLGPLGLISLSARGGIAGIRRGPGRPRLRPTGPGHQGYRAPGHHHGKKIQRPLPVPIRSHQTITGISQHQQKTILSSQRSIPGSSSTSSSSSISVTAANTASSSSSTESRPFGFYTQQQPRTGS
jgi:DNA helicase INO80